MEQQLLDAGYVLEFKATADKGWALMINNVISLFGKSKEEVLQEASFLLLEDE